MASRIRAKFTYANVMATIAVFIALGGGAYALSGVPDQAGIFHGCVNKKTGLLRVVAMASSCHKATAHGKHRDPGELAISWSQQGPRGDQGIQGARGAPGPTTGASTGGNIPPTSPNNGTLWATTNITIPTAGSLFVLGTAKAGMGCNSSGGCTTTWGIYLDGAPVPNTAQTVSAAANVIQLDDITLAGIMPKVAAGSHTLTIQDNGSANVFSSQMQDRSLTGIALGG